MAQKMQTSDFLVEKVVVSKETFFKKKVFKKVF